MYTLFKVMTMETWATIARYTASRYPGAEVFFVLYIFCTSLLAEVGVGRRPAKATCEHALMLYSHWSQQVCIDGPA